MTEASPTALATAAEAPRRPSPTPPQKPLDDEARWQAVSSRDASADGHFFYAVRTTGIYCYPSCPARRPERRNVSFHESRSSARAAGFRACRKCQPDLPPRSEREARQVVRLCRLIDDLADGEGGEPRLERLAEHAGLSPSRTQRLFKKVTGVTPKAYAAARRAERVRNGLCRDGGSVISAIYEAGYGSAGRFYEKSRELLGMTPAELRRGGPSSVVRFAVGECSLGSVLVAATDAGVCSVLLGDDPDELVRDLERRFSRATLVGADADFEALVSRVVGLVENPGGGSAALPLDIRGTAFQRRVWRALLEIPPGQARSYRQVAETIGAPGAARAVGRACAENPIAVAIPCHRVVRADGNPSGYRWGIDRKRALLSRERPETPDRE